MINNTRRTQPDVISVRYPNWKEVDKLCRILGVSRSELVRIAIKKLCVEFDYNDLLINQSRANNRQW